jgi:competence protein ComEA
LQSRIFDVIKLSGGQIPNADFSSVNLAEVVKDGQRIVIPHAIVLVAGDQGTLGIGTKVLGAKVLGSVGNDKKININTATEAELDKLPGVGPATAKQIVEARPFSKIEDLLKISRFGKSKVERIRARVIL